MKKFGFGKKGGDDGDDANRNALFGGRKKQQPSQSDNPYAQKGGNDPYAQPAASDPYADSAKYANVTPYQAARSQISSGPPGGPPGPGNSGGRPGGPQGASPGGPQGGPAGGQGGGYGGYSSDRYGSGGGYGSNRYDNNAGSDRYSGASSARGPGGYGGFGRPGDKEPDDNRDALLSGAQERYTQRQHTAVPSGGNPQPDQPGAADSYGGYGEQRELTEEEQEEAEYQAILAEKRQVQQDKGIGIPVLDICGNI